MIFNRAYFKRQWIFLEKGNWSVWGVTPKKLSEVSGFDRLRNSEWTISLWRTEWTTEIGSLNAASDKALTLVHVVMKPEG